VSAPALPSAAVLLARSGAHPETIEVLMLRRGAGAAAFGGAWVFPGGVVQANDHGAAESAFGPDEAMAELTRRGADPPPDAGAALAIWRCALRELFEEAGVLLAHDAAGRPFTAADPDAPGIVELRRALREGRLPLVDLLAAEGLRADYRALVPFSHWITPTGLPRRFDTRFFVAAMPAGQAAAHCGVETTEARWVEPHDALRAYHEGAFPLVLPTRLHLQRIAPFRTVAALLAEAAAKPIRTVQPNRPDPARDEAAAEPAPW
jgi:8-oxo-dGTP pyrophosphatase MutT (NUDIX family)